MTHQALRPSSQNNISLPSRKLPCTHRNRWTYSAPAFGSIAQLQKKEILFVIRIIHVFRTTHRQSNNSISNSQSKPTNPKRTRSAKSSSRSFWRLAFSAINVELKRAQLNALRKRCDCINVPIFIKSCFLRRKSFIIVFGWQRGSKMLLDCNSKFCQNNIHNCCSMFNIRVYLEIWNARYFKRWQWSFS